MRKKIIRKQQPWWHSYVAAKGRCNNPNNGAYKNYGGRGIKFLLSFEEMGRLYLRDRASSLQQPTIDRIDNDGDYVFSNCRFIEKSANSRRQKGIRRKPEIVRALSERVRGAKNPRVRLTESQVKLVRRQKGVLSGVELAKWFLVDKTTIYDIWNRRTWRHV